MDDELNQLEAELQRLRPVAPAAELSARIEAELTPRRKNPFVLLGWVALPVAAAVALVLSWPRPELHPPALTEASHARMVSATPAAPAAKPSTSFKPVAAQNFLVAARDEGLVTLSDGAPARRYRRAYLDTITWENPRTRASVKWTVPREEERIIPVVYQ